ncbi:SH3 domain-containing protein [Streptomyces triticagri]|uniref:SH3 domain-containing protein n=1 Tax=Streptomyces triticagri TaxID=2293568 RepID=A0A372M6I3_9ACTN|nr:SH3 domain-containing protein [Streptomyces triticagri]RFU85907.1 SH3 domain-containing protein [Streptomyces triticagri]
MGGLTAVLLAGGGLAVGAGPARAAGVSAVTAPAAAPAHDWDGDGDGSGGGRFEIHWESSFDLRWESGRGHDSGRDSGRGPNWGTVISPSDLNVRAAPYVSAPRVGTLAPGTQDRVTCRADGGSVQGNTSWYWLAGARGWASSAYVETDRRVPPC